jgi:hypothetical protein
MHPAALRLAAYVHDGGNDPAAAELAGWMTDSPRFRAFVEAHRDKIRKKLRGAAADGAARLDVQAELHVAYRLLADRRITIAFEAAGSARGGPDFAVTFRDHPAFNLEVTRLRRGPDAAVLRRVVLVKLRQMPTGAANVLLVIGKHSGDGSPGLEAAMRDLRSRADAPDAATLRIGGFTAPRDFHRGFARIGAVVAWHGANATVWPNPSARIAVPERALRACVEVLGRTDR